MHRILIVDDDTDLLLWLKTFLTRKGYHVTATTTCDEAVHIAKQTAPDLILMDVNVGDRDGRETCREIKQLAGYEHIPVILISADHGQLEVYKDYNASSSLPKPFSGQQLLEIIKLQIGIP